MAPMLSQNEMDALLSAMRAGQLDVTSDDALPQRECTPYDLTSQDRVIRGQLPTLDTINDQIASMLAVGLGGRLRIPVGVTAQPAELMKFTDFNALLRPPATFVVLGLGSVQGQGVMVVPDEITRALLAAALGDRNARIQDLSAEVRRDLTAVERKVFTRVLAAVCEAMGRAWASVLPMQPTVLRLETDPRLAQVAPPADVAILNSLDIALGENGATATLRIAIPFASVESVKKQLSATARTSNASDQRFERALREQVREIPVEVTGVLGHASMALRDFLALKVGDVLTLDTPEARPLPVLVQGVHLSHGTPEVVAGGMAMVLDDEIGVDPTKSQPAKRVA